MFVGFDYGTSNCAVGRISEGKPELISLGDQGDYLSSTLYAAHRNMLAGWIARNLPDTAEKQNFIKLRAPAIQATRRMIQDGYDDGVFFGQAALDAYLEEPEEGYYIKSPKSFLGATSLSPPQRALMEDVVTAMICNIKNTAEQKSDQSITQVVMGKPVNFQGLRGDESNQQALSLLTTAAKRAGFKEIEFLYEPLAAGFEYEESLTKEKTVLVVDIGGGTTDCSLLKMGPDHQNVSDRFEHVLGYTGERIGGNDFDIHFAQKSLMPLFGLNSQLVNGLPMPVKPFWDAVAINDIGSQTHFYSQSNLLKLKDLYYNAEAKDQVARLIKLQQQKQTYQLVNVAEQMKKALSVEAMVQAPLEFIEDALRQDLHRDQLEFANRDQLSKIKALIDETLVQAQTNPDVLFVTGGTAKSPMIYQFLQQHYGECEIVIGDHFGSVTKGLTRWAGRIFR